MSEIIWTALGCFVAGMALTAVIDLVRDLIVARQAKRELKRAMIEYSAGASADESSGIEYARCTCDRCRAIADVAAARATLDAKRKEAS